MAVADEPLGAGAHTIRVEVVRDAERRGDVTLSLDGAEVARARVPRLVGMLSSTGMDIGRAIAPVNHDYQPPFAYGGTIKSVRVVLAVRATNRDKEEEARGEARAAMTRQ